MIDVPTLFERSHTTRNSYDFDHTYCSEEEGYGVPLTQRLIQFRDEGIGCDVEFMVGSERKTIQAHRLVLGSGSKVFAAMFYGKMSEMETRSGGTTPNGRTLIEVPDVTPGAFTTLINFLYTDLNTDSVKLDDDAVMHTLYAAKKYDVRTLVLACVRYLMSCLTASNAVCLLAQARFFDEPFLMKRCFEVIDANTDEALSSPGLRDIDRDTLSAILERSELDPSNELVIFKAAQAWSEAECERQRLEVTAENQRDVLGPVLSLIRFPLMTVHEFGEAASSSLLTCEEIAQVFLHLTVMPRPPVSYPTGLRCNGRSKHVVQRFPNLSGKRCNKRENRFCFTADRDIMVSGFGIYGFVPMTKPHISFMDPSVALEWQAQVEIQLNPYLDPREGTPNANCVSAVETVLLKGIMGDVKPLVANFSKPVVVPANINYVAGMKFMSDATVQTYGGKDGVEFATVQLPFDETVTFRFQCFKNSYGNEDVSRFEGQLPEIYFFVQWPDGTH
uniref:BTB domain-containing protein n=1 Tax=Parascaris univalens TaxID=6257 RepID=A0A915BU54_PARUN